VPYLNWNRDNRQVKLNANYADNADPNWAVPVFRERLPKQARQEGIHNLDAFLVKRLEPAAEHFSYLVKI